MIENIKERLNQIVHTTLREVVGQHTIDDMLAETSKINVDIKQMLDLQTADWGVLVTLVGLRDIRLPDTMSERWHAKRTRPLELQPRNFQTPDRDRRQVLNCPRATVTHRDEQVEQLSVSISAPYPGIGQLGPSR